MLFEYGWGKDEYGTFWNEGSCVWEVFILIENETKLLEM